MFEKFMEKLSKKEVEKDELEFKPFEQTQRAEIVAPQVKEIEVPEKKPAETRSNGVELKVIRPESYEEVRTVADNLIAGCTVVLNVEALDKPVIFRMLDFLNGVTYCQDGEIKRVAPSTFIITPHSDVDISDM
jgi:cell division inhibitor SepF